MRSPFLAPLAVVVAFAAMTPPETGHARESVAPVGLSLWFQDGLVRRQDLTPKTTLLLDGVPRFIQEMDITASVTTTDDEGITPVTRQGDLADLDWSGVTQVEEEYRPLNDGTTRLVRQRYYRGAGWMKDPSAFLVLPEDAAGNVVGDPLLANAGIDRAELPSDDGFVRRFVARQVASPCDAVGDCSAATSYVAEGLVQFRDALHPIAVVLRLPRAAPIRARPRARLPRARHPHALPSLPGRPERLRDLPPRAADGARALLRRERYRPVSRAGASAEAIS